MTVDFISLFIIVALSAVCPLIADRIPRKAIPETVLLLLVGCIFGPHLLEMFHLDETIVFLSDLGAAFLFLLAGYEIEPEMLKGGKGRRGFGAWAVSFALALAAVAISPGLTFGDMEATALAIMLTTTAIGTLMPILAERELIGTPVGNNIISYGVWGEMCPILAIVLLLSARATFSTIVILFTMVALCVLVALRASRAKRDGEAIFKFLEAKSDSTSQTTVRITILLLIALVTLSAVFDMDIVLGAFAAGFVLRYIIPEGNRELESKLDGIGYGFFIPLFFVCSGAAIDPRALTSQPALFFSFIAAFMLIRCVPVFVSLTLAKDTHTMSTRSRASVAFYTATALPLIVAASSVAVDAGAMTAEIAGILVAAGATSVLIMPLIGQAIYNVADAYDVSCIIPDKPFFARGAEHKHVDSNLQDILDGFDIEHLHVPLHLRFTLEHLINSPVNADRIASIAAEELGFNNNEKLKEIVEERIEYLRALKKEETGCGSDEDCAEKEFEAKLNSKRSKMSNTFVSDDSAKSCEDLDCSDKIS